MIMDYNELNVLESTKDSFRSIPYEQYFGEMELEESEKEKRIELAKQLQPIFLLLFTLIITMGYTEEQALYLTKSRYKDTLSNFTILDEHLERYINDISEDIVNTTIKNKDDEYFTSYDRARYISENEAQTTMNYVQIREAIKAGKTKKKWNDIRDKRERMTHREVGGTTIPITEPFEVGDYLMMYPKDDSFDAGPEEIINCRCTVTYL